MAKACSKATGIGRSARHVTTPRLGRRAAISGSVSVTVMRVTCRGLGRDVGPASNLVPTQGTVKGGGAFGQGPMAGRQDVLGVVGNLSVVGEAGPLVEGVAFISASKICYVVSAGDGISLPISTGPTG